MTLPDAAESDAADVVVSTAVAKLPISGFFLDVEIYQITHSSEVLALKHDSSLFRQSSNPVPSLVVYEGLSCVIGLLGGVLLLGSIVLN